MRTGVYEGQLGMDAALERVQGTQWLLRARRAVDTFCDLGISFTSDEVRDVAGPPPSPNSIGALIHAIAEEGRIREIGTTRSRRPEAHGRRLTKWMVA